MCFRFVIVVVLLIFGLVLLVYFQLVVLKMLLFDNKSEFQIVVDMLVGMFLEEMVCVLYEIGGELVKEVDVVNYQVYVGMVSLINFNGLVCQYYLCVVLEKGDIQVNLVDKQYCLWQSYEIVIFLCQCIEVIGKWNGGVVKVVEVLLGLLVMLFIVVEIYGFDMVGQMVVGKQICGVFEMIKDIVVVDDYIEVDFCKFVLYVLQGKVV